MKLTVHIEIRQNGTNKAEVDHLRTFSGSTREAVLKQYSRFRKKLNVQQHLHLHEVRRKLIT